MMNLPRDPSRQVSAGPEPADWPRDGHGICAGRPEPTRLRCVPRGHPELRTARAPVGFMIRLIDSGIARGRHGEDRSIGAGEPLEHGTWDHVGG